MFRTSSSTSAIQIKVRYNRFDSGSGKLVEKSQRIIKSWKTPKAWKVAKVIGLKKCLSSH